MNTRPIETFTIGQVVTFYPRANGPGHLVEIIDLVSHPLYGTIIWFCDAAGRVQSRTWGKFFTSPE